MAGITKDELQDSRICQQPEQYLVCLVSAAAGGTPLYFIVVPAFIFILRA
jgi:hypothetical protein